MGTDRTAYNSRPTQQRQQRAKRWNENEFVRLELSKEQQAECKAWCKTLDELDSAAVQFVDAGYRISVKWDSYSNSYSSFGQLADDNGEHANSRLVLTGRGSTPLKALKQMLFKHFVVLDENWGDDSSPARSDVLDD